MKKYFLYHMRSALPRLAVIAAITLVWTVMSHGVSTYEIDNTIHYCVSLPGGTMIIVSAVVAALEFMPFKNRRNLDALLSVPVDRVKMSASHLLCGATQVAIVTATAALTAFVSFIPHLDVLNVGYYPLYFLFLLFGSLISYFFYAFVFNKANTVADGVIFMVLVFFIPTFLGDAIASLLNIRWNHQLYRLFYGYMEPLPIIMTSDVASCFRELTVGGTVSANSAGIAVYTVYSLIGIACAFGAVRELSHCRAEKVGGISDSIFGYKLYIPLLGFSLILGENETASIILMLLGYCVYRRGIRLKRSDIIILAVAATLTLLTYIL